MRQTEAALCSAHRLHCLAVTHPSERLTTNDTRTAEGKSGKSIAISTGRDAWVQRPRSPVSLHRVTALPPITGQDPDLRLTGL